MNKEIIIDGVNVAECEFAKLPIMKRPKNLIEKIFGKDEKIKNVRISCKIKDLEYDFLNSCERNKDCYFKQLQRLEKENEELKERLSDAEAIMITYRIVKEQYKQALEEIREIATEPSKDINVVYNHGYHITLEKILCKIKEALND